MAWVPLVIAGVVGKVGIQLILRSVCDDGGTSWVVPYALVLGRSVLFWELNTDMGVFCLKQ